MTWTIPNLKLVKRKQHAGKPMQTLTAISQTKVGQAKFLDVLFHCNALSTRVRFCDESIDSLEIFA